jgi:hypothetical protein
MAGISFGGKSTCNCAVEIVTGLVCFVTSGYVWLRQWQQKGMQVKLTGFGQ